jgi:hypothetical protein
VRASIEEGRIVQPVASYDERKRRRYRWCPSCRELWATGRFAATCPLCDGRTLAYVGRSPYDEAVTERRRRGPESVEGLGGRGHLSPRLPQIPA